MFQTQLVHQIGNSVDRPMFQTSLLHQIGNSVDRPMIKPTLVHKNGQFHGQTHDQTNTRPQKGAISRTDPCSKPNLSTKLAIPWTDPGSRPHFSTKLAIPWTDPCSNQHSSTKTGNFTDRPMFQTLLVHKNGQFRGQTHDQTHTRPQKGAISRTDPQSKPSLKFGEAGYWSDIEG